METSVDETYVCLPLTGNDGKRERCVLRFAPNSGPYPVRRFDRCPDAMKLLKQLRHKSGEPSALSGHA